MTAEGARIRATVLALLFVLILLAFAVPEMGH